MLHWPENVVIPLEGVLVVLMSIMIWKHLQSGLEFPKFMKKDSDSRSSSSGGSCFPATKENKTTHYAAYFTTVTCTLTGTEGKVSGPIQGSNILKRTFMMEKNLHI